MRSVNGEEKCKKHAFTYKDDVKCYMRKCAFHDCSKNTCFCGYHGIYPPKACRVGIEREAEALKRIQDWQAPSV